MEQIPVTRVRSGIATPHRPYPTDTRILADHGLHTINRRGTTWETAWVTVVSLWVEGRQVAYDVIRTDPASEPDEAAEQPTIDRLTRWWRVVAALTELDDLEDRLAALRREIEAAETLGEDRPVLYRELDQAQARIRTLRAVMVERARGCGDRAELDGVALGEYRPGMPAPAARAELARHDLAAWAERTADRDAIVQEALTIDMDKVLIHRLTGIARTTIDRIEDAASTG